MYKVYLADKKVGKTLEKLSSPARESIQEAILGLEKDPRPQGTRMLSGKLKAAWRLRVGDYRILYDIEDQKRQVFILDIGHRREIYR